MVKARLYIPWPHGSGEKLVHERDIESKVGVIVDQDTRKHQNEFRVFVFAGWEDQHGRRPFPQDKSEDFPIARYFETTYLFADVPVAAMRHLGSAKFGQVIPKDVELVWRWHSTARDIRRVWRSDWSGDQFELLTLGDFNLLQQKCDDQKIELQEALDSEED